MTKQKNNQHTSSLEWLPHILGSRKKSIVKIRTQDESELLLRELDDFFGAQDEFR